MNKKLITMTMITLAGFGLAACGQQSSSSSSKASSESPTSKKAAVASSSSKSSVSSSSSSSASSSSSSQAEEIDDNTLAVLVGLQSNEEWFRELIDSDNGIYFNDKPVSGADSVNGEFNGYLIISGHGDAASVVYFKRDGDNVIYTTYQTGEGGFMYNGHYVKNTVPLSELIENYYQSASQKAEVAKFTSEFKTDAN